MFCVFVCVFVCVCVCVFVFVWLCGCVFVFVCLCLWQRFGAVFFVAKVNNSLTSDYIFEIE